MLKKFKCYSKMKNYNLRKKNVFLQNIKIKVWVLVTIE